MLTKCCKSPAKLAGNTSMYYECQACGRAADLTNTLDEPAIVDSIGEIDDVQE